MKQYSKVRKLGIPCGVRLTDANMEYYNKHRDSFVWASTAEGILDLAGDKNLRCVLWCATYRKTYISVFQIVNKVEIF